MKKIFSLLVMLALSLAVYGLLIAQPKTGGTTTYLLRPSSIYATPCFPGSLRSANIAGTISAKVCAADGLSWQSLAIGSAGPTANTTVGALPYLSATNVFSDSPLFRENANTLAQRNGTTSQQARIYETYTNSSNGRWLQLDGFAGASGIFLNANGTGIAAGQPLVLGNVLNGPVQFYTNNTLRWQINAGGHLITNSDNAYDIGADGATRPRTGYFGTSVVAPIFLASNGTAGAPGLAFSSNPMTGFRQIANVIVQVTNGIDNAEFSSGSTFTLYDNNAKIRMGASNDVGIARDGAGLLRVSNGSSGYGKLVMEASVNWLSGSGSPEGVITAGVGSLYTRTDGGANITLYIKESGNGNTGWVAK